MRNLSSVAQTTVLLVFSFVAGERLLAFGGAQTIFLFFSSQTQLTQELLTELLYIFTYVVYMYVKVYVSYAFYDYISP